MDIHTVRVDGQMFVLKPGTDVGRLRDEIVDAARQGAGFVELETVGRSTINVMITPHVGVRFETIQKLESDVDDWEANPPPVDFDYFGTYDSLL